MNENKSKFELTEDASRKLKKIAKSLDIDETEVIRQGIELLGLFATLNEENGDAIFLKKGESATKLKVAHG